jgi:methionine-rich copper-binding protein CopC
MPPSDCGRRTVRLNRMIERPLRRRAAIALAVAATAWRPYVAAAHVYLDRAEPAPGAVDVMPSRVILTFSGPLDIGSNVRLLDALGSDVPGAIGEIDPTDRTRLVVAIPECPPGVYTVSWVAVSVEDGHAAPGFHGILVGGAAPPVGQEPPSVLDGAVADLDISVVPALQADGAVTWAVRTIGPSADSVQRVLVTFVPPMAELGAVQVTAVPDATGVRIARFLPTLVGVWRVDTIVRRTGVADDIRQRHQWIASLPTA